MYIRTCDTGVLCTLTNITDIIEIIFTTRNTYTHIPTTVANTVNAQSLRTYKHVHSGMRSYAKRGPYIKAAFIMKSTGGSRTISHNNSLVRITPAHDEYHNVLNCGRNTKHDMTEILKT